MITIAIDPGDRHVGCALATGREVRAAREYDAEGFADAFASELDAATLSVGDPARVEVVVEAFVLYPMQDRKNVWNPMRTSEMIGAIKLLCQQRDVPVVEQGASIKKPTRNQLRARGIKQIGRGPHARDAELHLWYRLLRRPDGPAA